MKSKLLTVIAIFSLLAILTSTLPTINQPAKDANEPMNGFHVELYVYKNNKLIYYDPNDPTVQNFAYIIAELLDLDNDALEAPIGNRMDGQQTWTSNYPITRTTKGYGYTIATQGTIIVGEDSLFSRSDYTLAKIHGIVLIDEFNITLSNNTIKIIVGGSYTLPTTAAAPINITAVGLGITTVGPGNQPSTSNTWLLLKDPLSVPVTLQPGDTIHVRYVISLP